jgi:hypothetical protein
MLHALRALHARLGQAIEELPTLETVLDAWSAAQAVPAPPAEAQEHEARPGAPPYPPGNGAAAPTAPWRGAARGARRPSGRLAENVLQRSVPQARTHGPASRAGRGPIDALEPIADSAERDVRVPPLVVESPDPSRLRPPAALGERCGGRPVKPATPWWKFLLELVVGAACAGWIALITLHVLGLGPRAARDGPAGIEPGHFY